MSFPDEAEFDDVQLKQPSKSTELDYDNLKKQLKAVGLDCPYTNKENLDKDIKEIRAGFGSQKDSADSFMITRPSGNNEGVVEEGLLVGGSHDLIEAMGNAGGDLPVFFEILASSHPGTQDFVREITAGNSWAEDFVADVLSSGTRTQGFIADLTDDEGGSVALATRLQAPEAGPLLLLAALAGNREVPDSVGEWIPDEDKVKNYARWLHDIQYINNWNVLKREIGFLGGRGREKKEPRYKKKADTADNVKMFFKNTAANAGAAITKNLQKKSTEAILANRIKPLTKENLKDYESNDSLTLYLVQDYDYEKKQAGAMGVLTIEWKLMIANYKAKRKSDDDPWALLDINTRRALYLDAKSFCCDHKLIKPNDEPLKLCKKITC